MENERLVEIAAKDKDDLASKDKEIQELNTLNEKYRAYLEKAKYVIQNINTPESSMEMHQLRQQLADKDKSIKHLMVILYCIFLSSFKIQFNLIQFNSIIN